MSLNPAIVKSRTFLFSIRSASMCAVSLSAATAAAAVRTFTLPRPHAADSFFNVAGWPSA